MHLFFLNIIVFLFYSHVFHIFILQCGQRYHLMTRLLGKNRHPLAHFLIYFTYWKCRKARGFQEGFINLNCFILRFVLLYCFIFLLENVWHKTILAKFVTGTYSVKLIWDSSCKSLRVNYILKLFIILVQVNCFLIGISLN